MSASRPTLLPRVLGAALALALSATAGAAGFIGLPQFSPSAMQPARINGDYVPPLRGNWILSGYGHLYTIRRDGADIYDQAGGLCWRDDAASVEAANLFQYWGRSLFLLDTAFSELPDSMQYHIDPLWIAPPACASWINRSSRLYIFDAIANLLIDYYPYQAERGVDFVQRKAQLRPLAAAAKNDEDLAAVVTELFDGLDDAHSGANMTVDGVEISIGQSFAKASAQLLAEKFIASGETNFFQWIKQWNASQIAPLWNEFDPATRGKDLAGTVTWGVLPGNVGYLGIDSMAYDETLDQATARARLAPVLDTALDALANTSAIVVDVTANTGGYALYASDIAGRFADKEYLAYTKHARGAWRAAPHRFYTKPSGNVRYTGKPVVLLTSDITVSAGELFTLHMRALPQVKQVGMSTQGAVSGGIPRGLPNGWQVGFPIEVTRDAQGRVHEVSGIPPSVNFDVFPAATFDTGRADAVHRAAEIALGR